MRRPLPDAHGTRPVEPNPWFRNWFRRTALAALALTALACPSLERDEPSGAATNGEPVDEGKTAKNDSKPDGGAPQPDAGRPIRIEIGCAGPCNRGELLLFHVAGLRQSGFLGAAAIPEATQRDRIWLFPTESGRAPAVEAGSELRLVPRGVRLGDDFPPGRYEVRLWITRQPPSRSGLAREDEAGPEAGAARTLTSQTLPLEVRP